MSEIVHLAAARTERQQSQDVLWQRFIDAKEKSQTTLKIEDAVAAGHAYREFLETFTKGR